MNKYFILIITCVLTIPCLGAPTLEFSPGGPDAGSWSYNGAGILSFSQDITVDKGLGNPAGPLVGALVDIPSLLVGGIPGGPYTVTPLGTGIVNIKDPGGTIYMTGILGPADLFPVGTTAVAYTNLQVDITNATVTAAGLALASPALNAIHNSTGTLDFELSLQGGPNTFKSMLDNGLSWGDGFSGSMNVTHPIPVPGAFLLATMGIGLAGIFKRRGYKGLFSI